ncbi:hypothetical protein TSUD_153570 [Trifolium subterraneum]|uniref:Uncharacterized protein n=1 Tax=Trifolium subterraneum TaxID=3900 RepID=A0A2Z6N9L8_TRISU|nr:hypothetical protein TSUD_153570 [Trifolium subterraneum]
MVILRELSDESGSPLPLPLQPPGYRDLSLSFGKQLVEYQHVVPDASPVLMDSVLKYNSAGMIRCFREIVKLYSRENEEEIVVDPVGEDELVTTVNTVEPHYFYMYGSVIQTFNLWFPLTQFEGDVLRILNVAPLGAWDPKFMYKLGIPLPIELIGSGNGLNMYLNPRVRGSIPTEGKNSTREGGGEDCEVAVPGPPMLVGPGLLQPPFNFIQTLGALSRPLSQPNRGLFTLYASNFKNYQDTFLRLRGGPKLPDLMYDSEGKRLFPFYWSDNPTLIKGVREEMLTPFEKETVHFLDSFLILDIKDVLRRENDAKSILSFLKRMKRVPDEEWLAYLGKSKQKKLAPDAHVDPSLQLIIDADNSKGVKRKRKTEGSKVTIKVPRKEGDSSGAAGEVIPPPRVVTRTTRSSTATAADIVADGNASEEVGVTDKGESVSTDGMKGLGKGPIPEGVQPISAATTSCSGGTETNAWGSEFDPVVLSHLMSVRQDKEVQEAGVKVGELEKTISTLQSRHDKEEARMKKELDSLKKEREADANKLKKDKEDSLAELQMKHDAAVELLKKKHAEDVALLERVNVNLVRSRNACIVALCQHARDAALTLEDLKDLEDENAALKEEMADRYVDGFAFAVEQMRVVFPDVDPSLLAELDFMKKIEGGRLVPR